MDAVNGNMSRDPYFCDTSAGDYSIDSLSPCAPYHPDNDCDHLIGALPPGCAVLADSDGDFVPDGLDNCPSTANHDQNDYDSDGVGDVCDNCPATPNLDQSNTDGDALGDACDPGEVLFSTDRQCGGAPLTVNFTDESVPLRPISSWFWDFGDNESSTEQNPQHQYQASGVYTVQLFITDDQGNLDSLIVDDCVAVLDSIVADFIALPASGAPPLTVAFDPNLDGIANTFFWDFGDGQTSTEENPIHVYNTVGRYSVRLKVGLSMDECAFEDSVIKQDYVAVKDLRAYFQGSPRAGVDPLTVQFSDLSSGSPVQWRWDFGDGGSSTFQNPSHQYTLPGVYDVSLWVSDGIFTDSLKRLGHVHVDTAWADLSLTISDIGARPGFPIYFFYEYQNSGTVAATNTFIRMVPPEGVTSFATYWAPELPYEWVGDTLIVDLGTVEPGEDTTVIARGILSEYTPIGEILHVKGWITTDTRDVDLDNNYYEHLVVVTGSIDPNDKKVSPDGTGPQHYLAAEQRLSYIIQFENKPEATAEAIYVRIVDTLDPDLDWSTLAIGAISHPDKCKSYFDPYSGVLSWVCDSIMLPPNNTPPEGEGYVKFSISPKADLPLETQISNTAWIRFDYNAWLQAPETGAVIRTIKPPSCCGLYTSGYTGNADCSTDGRLTLADITRLIDRIYISGIELCCDENGNVDGSLDDRLSLNDITYLIDHVYLTHVPTAPCP
jgi:PKD repeat protein